MKTKPVKPNEVESSKRINNFEEVISVYTENQALEEASRCLQCKNPTCIDGCPVNIDIKKFIYHITQKDYRSAYLKIREKNNFASICGRVCPAEYQCRKVCVLNKRNSPFASEEAINIHFLERFAGDYGIENKLEVSAEREKRLSDVKVAVVGSGPAGLCCAGELARQGVKVVIFEALHKPGGVLRYGIPPFRLPADILDYEINCLKKLGVEIAPNFVVGKVKKLTEFFDEGFFAVFLGLGAGVPSFLGVNGENLGNIYSANEYLTRVNLMSAYKFPEFHTPVNTGKNVIVIGGGNTAMDAARTALRLQIKNGFAPNTTVFYRRTEVEMPARRLEIEHAKEEGIKFEFLSQPVEFTGSESASPTHRGEDGCVNKMKALKCSLGEADSSGRKRPVSIKGSGFDVNCDLAIIAVGLKANQLLTKVTPELKLDEYGDIVANKDTMETSVKSVFAGGDIVGGEGTVIEAMGMAKKAAVSILQSIRK